MKLEDLPKYYSPKSPGLTDASASTSKDALSITAVSYTHLDVYKRQALDCTDWRDD